MVKYEMKMKQYMAFKYVLSNNFWFVTERTFGCVPLLRYHLSCKTTFLGQRGVVSDDRFYCNAKDQGSIPPGGYF